MAQKKIAKVFGMTADQVAHSLKHRRQNIKFEKWVEQWENEL